MTIPTFRILVLLGSAAPSAVAVPIDTLPQRVEIPATSKSVPTERLPPVVVIPPQPAVVVIPPM